MHMNATRFHFLDGQCFGKSRKICMVIRDVLASVLSGRTLMAVLLVLS